MSETRNQVAAVVGILDLQVILAKEDGYWIAQAIELDYAAYGDTEDEAKRNFENGLRLTIQDHFDEFGDLDNMIRRQAPPELWRDLAIKGGSKGRMYSQVSIHPIDLPIPFGQIKYHSEAQIAA
jgi:predicted RNase H-like HicB family nuclease